MDERLSGHELVSAMLSGELRPCGPKGLQPGQIDQVLQTVMVRASAPPSTDRLMTVHGLDVRDGCPTLSVTVTAFDKIGGHYAAVHSARHDVKLCGCCQRSPGCPLRGCL